MKHNSQPVALITGASRGLGSYLIQEIAKLGYSVVIHYRSGEARARRLAREIKSLGAHALCVQSDLSNPNQVTRLFNQISRRFGRLDLLINNAGTYRPTPLLRTRPEDWLAGLHSTATATFLATQSAIPLFPKIGGRIINLGDSASDRITPRKLAPGYHVGKIGVSLLTRSFATQLISRKITVNQISPGYLENSIDLPAHYKLPSGRPVSFSEVFSAVRYFLSPDASQVTGNNLIISGGWNL
jgi:3-oxoacyl-[acyl-carrier protein] reductase